MDELLVIYSLHIIEEELEKLFDDIHWTMKKNITTQNIKLFKIFFC